MPLWTPAFHQRFYWQDVWNFDLISVFHLNLVLIEHGKDIARGSLKVQYINSTVNSKSVISVLFSIDHIAAQFYLPVKKMFLGGASIFFWEGSHVDLTWARFLVVPLLPAVLREDILNIWKQSPMQVKTFSNVQSIASEKHLKMSNQSAKQKVLLDCQIKRGFQLSTEQRCQSLNSTLLLLPSFQNRFVSLQEQPTAGCVQETTREHNRRHYTTQLISCYWIKCIWTL